MRPEGEGGKREESNDKRETKRGRQDKGRDEIRGKDNDGRKE